MPNETQQTPIQIAWINYVNAVQTLLGPQIDDRSLYQFFGFRDAVLNLVNGEQFLTDLNTAWLSLSDHQPYAIGNALLLELEAFPRAAEVVQATMKSEEGKGWWRTMLGRASTVSGSVKDLMENLPPNAKNALTLFKDRPL